MENRNKNPLVLKRHSNREGEEGRVNFRSAENKKEVKGNNDIKKRALKMVD